ncbi:MAG: type II secretion system F family protein, partial [Ignavibacteria bacterium]|nr:type II secretion system F family protein [Ignavibacteria bacterium]
MPLYVAVSFVFLAIFCLVFGVVKLLIGDQLVLKDRLQQMEVQMTKKNKLGYNEELEADFTTRIIKPISDKTSGLIQKYTPVRQIGFIEQKLDYAGRPNNWSANQYLLTQYLTTLAAAILAFVIAWVSGAGPVNRILALLVGLIGGYLMFELWMTSRISARRKAIEKALPDVLDLLTISIEAGLGFDAAMQRVVQKSSGPISEEFNQTLQEMRIGKTRREALSDMSFRTGVPNLSRFVASLIQADQLGISLGNVLRNQSDQMRILRRQRVQEEAQKAPIKMLFPTMVFILPTMFIVLLAPAIVQLAQFL